jgi:hypothetical protein
MPTEGAHDMNAFLTKTHHARLLLLAVGGVLMSGMACATDEDTPFYLTASETLMRDSNFSRTDQATPETISSTGLAVGLNKDYGRQNYQLKGQLAANRYMNYKSRLNNDSKLLNGGFRTGILSNWELNLGGAYNQSLNPIKDNVSGDRVVKNIRSYRDTNAALKYGVDGLFSLTGSYDRNNVGYSRTSYRSSEARQKGNGLQATYYATDLLNYSLGWRGVATKYPGSNDRTVNDRNVDLSTNWQVTGLSNFNATITRRRSTYSEDKDKKFRGWNGSLNWLFTPHGLLTYNLGWSKYNGTDRQANSFTSAAIDVSNVAQRIDTLNTSTNYRAGVNAQLTGKLSVGYNYGLSKNRYNYTSLYSGVDGLDFNTRLLNGFYNYGQDVTSVSHTSTVSLNYNPLRWLQTQCSAQLYSQTRDQYGIRYSGREYDCTVSFTLD